jgi:hypothetical protein
MTVHAYGISSASHITSGLAADFVPDVRETNAVMGEQTAVALYSLGLTSISVQAGTSVPPALA